MQPSGVEATGFEIMLNADCSNPKDTTEMNNNFVDVDVEADCSRGEGKRNNNINYDETLKAAAKFNKKMNEERKARRAAYFDMQTFTCHYPRTNKGRMRVVRQPAPGHFPVPYRMLSPCCVSARPCPLTDMLKNMNT